MPEGNKDVHFFERLQQHGAAVIDQASASQQDIRPARIGLLNLMPAPVMEATELRWLRSISHTVLQIEPVLMKFDDDVRGGDGRSRKQILERYQSFSDVAEQGLDGLIVTGDNQELGSDGALQPFSELYYQKDLERVVDWADRSVPAIIYSCLASHFALKHRFGLERQLNREKIFGVFGHNVIKRTQAVESMDDSITAPHSRWGDIKTSELEAAGVDVLAANEDIGWLLAETATSIGGRAMYLQGHPEYWRNDLHNEYVRDQKTLPADYYPDGDHENRPSLTWSNDSRSLLSNWISRIYQDYSL